MIKLWRISVTLALLIVIFRLGPTPRQVQADQPNLPGRVVAVPSWRVGYAAEDGSFMAWLVAGCLPWRSCAINEPTDWWIGAK